MEGGASLASWMLHGDRPIRWERRARMGYTHRDEHVASEIGGERHRPTIPSPRCLAVQQREGAGSVGYFIGGPIFLVRLSCGCIALRGAAGVGRKRPMAGLKSDQLDFAQKKRHSRRFRGEEKAGTTEYRSNTSLERPAAGNKHLRAGHWRPRRSTFYRDPSGLPRRRLAPPAPRLRALARARVSCSPSPPFAPTPRWSVSAPPLASGAPSQCRPRAPRWRPWGPAPRPPPRRAIARKRHRHRCSLCMCLSRRHQCSGERC